MAAIARVISYEECLSMPAVPDAVDEVVQGEYRLIPPAGYTQAESLRRLNRLLDRQVDEAKVAIYNSTFGLLVNRQPLICRSPDLAVYWVYQIEIRDGLFCSAPALIVEVRSLPKRAPARTSEPRSCRMVICPQGQGAAGITLRRRKPFHASRGPMLLECTRP
jgi:hypothetical protein